jgi:hypothetical protein
VFLRCVRLAAEGFLPDDNYFDLPPLRDKAVVFKPVAPANKLKVQFEALNVDSSRVFMPHPSTVEAGA